MHRISGTSMLDSNDRLASCLSRLSINHDPTSLCVSRNAAERPIDCLNVDPIAVYDTLSMDTTCRYSLSAIISEHPSLGLSCSLQHPARHGMLMPSGHSCREEDPHKWRKRTIAAEGFASIYTLSLSSARLPMKNVDLITIFLPQTLKARAKPLDDGNSSSTRCRKANATNINFSNNRSRSHSARLQRPSSDKMASRPRD